MSIGYMGYAKLDTQLVLTTGANVGEVWEPIYSGSVRGAGWFHAGTSHYADDRIRYEGNIDFDLQPGLKTFIAAWIYTARTTAKQIIISPDGMKIHTYAAAYNSSANFSTSAGSFITCSLGVLALDRTETAGAASYIANSTGQDPTSTNPLNPSNNNQDPIPYWKSVVTLTGNSVIDGAAMDWNFDVSQNPVVVYACTGSQGALAVLMGEMDATASVVLYKDGGIGPVPAGANASNSSFVVVITVPAGTITLKLPAVVFEKDDYDVKDANSITSRAFTMKGMAGKNVSGIQPAFMMT
jgi:hypothetical protein